MRRISREYSAHDVESIIQESEAESHARTAEIDNLTVECMLANGFEYDGPTREYGEVDVAEGLTGEDRIDAVGSGTVAFALWRLDNDLSFGDVNADQTPDPMLDEALWHALQESVVVDGETIDGGCVRWAEAEYSRTHPEFEIRVQLDDAYGQHMAGAFQDIRLSELHDEWAECMSEDGFPGYHQPGDHMSDLERRIVEIESTSSSDAELRQRLEELLQFDIVVTQSAVTCWEQIEDRRNQLFGEYAQSFAEQYQGELEILGTGNSS